MKALQLVLAGVLVSTLAFARVVDEPTAERGVALTHEAGSSVFKLYYNAAEKSDVKVTILDKKGKQVFSEKIKKVSSFIKPYNLKGLTAGNYTVEIESKEGLNIEHFYYTAGKIEKNINIVRLPEGGKYLLSIQSKAADQVNLNILDRNQQVIHSKVYDVNKAFAEVLNLKNIQDFTIEVSDSDGVLKTVKSN